jgi:hypothetical protein
MERDENGPVAGCAEKATHQHSRIRAGGVGSKSPPTLIAILSKKAWHQVDRWHVSADRADSLCLSHVHLIDTFDAIDHHRNQPGGGKYPNDRKAKRAEIIV